MCNEITRDKLIKKNLNIFRMKHYQKQKHINSWSKMNDEEREKDKLVIY